MQCALSPAPTPALRDFDTSRQGNCSDFYHHSGAKRLRYIPICPDTQTHSAANVENGLVGGRDKMAEARGAHIIRRMQRAALDNSDRVSRLCEAAEPDGCIRMGARSV